MWPGYMRSLGLLALAAGVVYTPLELDQSTVHPLDHSELARLFEASPERRQHLTHQRNLADQRVGGFHSELWLVEPRESAAMGLPKQVVLKLWSASSPKLGGGPLGLGLAVSNTRT